jgi:predicted Zn-dependent protease
MLVSEESAIEASKDAYVEMLREPDQKGKLDNDPKLKARIDHITGRIVAQAIKYRPDTEAWEWQIHVIDDPKVVNAWAMAGGRMAIYTGLIEQVKPTDDELAQVLGHEISHALAKHTAERMSVAIATTVAVTAIGMSQDSNRGLVLTGAALAAALAVKLPNSRTAEAEADRIGIELAAKAGYNPNAAATLWEKMARVSGGSSVPEFLSTHPAPENRMETLRKLAPQMMPYYEAKGERPVYPLKSSAPTPKAGK